MGLSRSLLYPSRAPFYGIVPGAAATPIGQISLPVTFRTWENFCTEIIEFEVTDFETTYTTFLGWPTLSKFMAIPHYAYLVLKMPGPRGIVSIRGDVKPAFDYDRESYETANILSAPRVEASLGRAWTIAFSGRTVHSSKWWAFLVKC
jgi:hypothetical protein